MVAAELEKIYHELKLDLLRYLTSLCGDVGEAEDMFHSVFMKFIPVVKKGNLSAEEVRPYLFRMAHNHFRDIHRKRTRERDYIQDVESTYKADSESIHVSGSGEDVSEKIFAVINETLETQDNELSDRQKTVMQLRLVTNHKIEEIAKILDISRATAYRELEQGLIILRAALEKVGLTPEELVN